MKLIYPMLAATLLFAVSANAQPKLQATAIQSLSITVPSSLSVSFDQAQQSYNPTNPGPTDQGMYGYHVMAAGQFYVTTNGQYSLYFYFNDVNLYNSDKSSYIDGGSVTFRVGNAGWGQNQWTINNKHALYAERALISSVNGVDTYPYKWYIDDVHTQNFWGGIKPDTYTGSVTLEVDQL